MKAALVLALLTPEQDDDDDDDTVIDASNMADEGEDLGGVASGADSSLWTYSPTELKPDGPN